MGGALPGVLASGEAYPLRGVWQGYVDIWDEEGACG